MDKSSKQKLTIVGVFLILLVVIAIPIYLSNQSDDDGGSEPAEAEVGSISTDLETKPKIEPSSEEPTELETADVVEGEGPEAVEGDDVSVQYVGVLTDTGKEFDSSWSRDSEPFEFKLGEGGVIPGWDQGIPGMKVGGRRVLVIPPDLAYGTQGSPPTIPGNSTLTFVVDLEAIK
ncbi:MAG: FKBP-type peptidyl-prolyl cis-trans isomerase [Solirubrobacterales bacterium]